MTFEVGASFVALSRFANSSPLLVLLITSLSLLDDDLDDDLFADVQGSILSTVNLYPDAPSLIGAILRAMLEVSAEVVTFLEESFSDAESLVFAKPTTIYQQVLTQMKAELLVVRRDYAIMRTQVQALAGFLQGVAPSGEFSLFVNSGLCCVVGHARCSTQLLLLLH
jgi:hypothetical protein